MWLGSHTPRKKGRKTERQAEALGLGLRTQPIPVTFHYLSHDAKGSVSLFTGSNQISETEFGEVEKESFLALPGKGRHSELVL